MADETERPSTPDTRRASQRTASTRSAPAPAESSGRPPAARSSAAGEYVVVARRYRPQSFDDLVGQEMVSQALRNAITTDRVGHAYLFTGARGVGKTSTARILAKSLNCIHGPTPTPCGQCDICQQIASGEDVDVIEIDGASNRGIDEIRQLRSNVAIRPSRARFKIYIIDEVHMLTKEAFNALLKTLEEPPEHVKFIFCTTEPGKIPVTVLSRCQRFDFAPVMTPQIVERLQFIVGQEGLEADHEALELLARRAAGSMRDSQSLLEQLLSFVERRITVDDVHSLLGTAPNARLHTILEALNRRAAAAALAETDAAVKSGVDAGQLGEQLVGCLRDMMAIAVGGGADLLLHHTPSEVESLRAAADAWGLETLLAAVQIIDQAVSRMRYSVHERILLDLALVRVARLENLQSVGALLERLESGEGLDELAGGEKKKVAPASDDASRLNGVSGDAIDSASRRLRSDASHVLLGQSPHTSTANSSRTIAATSVKRDGLSVRSADAVTEAMLRADQVGRVWRAALEELNDMTADHAAVAETVAISGPNQLVVRFRQVYNSSKSFCERPDRRQTLEAMVSKWAGCRVGLSFESIPEDRPVSGSGQPAMSRQRQRQQVTRHPLVERAMALFEAELLSVDLPQAENGRGEAPCPTGR